jgi:hypothetical protein
MGCARRGIRDAWCVGPTSRTRPHRGRAELNAEHPRPRRGCEKYTPGWRHQTRRVAAGRSRLSRRPAVSKMSATWRTFFILLTPTQTPGVTPDNASPARRLSVFPSPAQPMHRRTRRTRERPSVARAPPAYNASKRASRAGRYGANAGSRRHCQTRALGARTYPKPGFPALCRRLDRAPPPSDPFCASAELSCPAGARSSRK